MYLLDTLFFSTFAKIKSSCEENLLFIGNVAGSSYRMRFEAEATR